MIVIDQVIGLRPFGSDGLALTLLPPVADWRREREVFSTLQDISKRIEATSELRRLVIDCNSIDRIPDEVRGAVIRLLLLFKERDGAVFCAAPQSTLEAFKMMRMDSFYRQADALSLPLPDPALIELCDDLTASLDTQRLAEAELNALGVPRYAPPRTLMCNGNLIFYTIHGNIAEVQLNPDVMSLEEEAEIAARFREAVSSVSESEPEVERVLLNLRGLEFMGADPVGALISMHNAGKAGRGARLALSNLEPPVAEKLAMHRLDRLLKIYARAEDARSAEW